MVASSAHHGTYPVFITRCPVVPPLAVYVTEFGTSPGDDPNTLVHTLDAQDEFMTGATL